MTTTETRASEKVMAAIKDAQGRPSPDAIDMLCLAYDRALAKQAVADVIVDEAKLPLLAAVRMHGSMPPNAERTKRLQGVIYIADSTVATSTEIVDQMVMELREDLRRRRKRILFGELFEVTEKFTLKKGAAELLKLGINALPESEQASILAIFAQCFNAKSKSPSLSVQLTEVLRRKEEEAVAKAAAKAAKKARAKKGGE